jgi:hypothetical protein
VSTAVRTKVIRAKILKQKLLRTKYIKTIFRTKFVKEAWFKQCRSNVFYKKRWKEKAFLEQNL